MADDPNVTASGVPNDDRSPHWVPESKLCSHVIEMNNRNLIVCIDDTASQFGEKVRVGDYILAILPDVVEKNTNALELYNLILQEIEHNQRARYNRGIGTDARPSWRSVLSHKIDLAIAWCVEWSLIWFALSSPLVHSGSLNKRFLPHISGSRRIMSTVIVYFSSVC